MYTSAGVTCGQRIRRQIDGGQALLVDLVADHSGERSHRLQGTGNSRHAFDEEQGELRTIRRKSGSRGVAF